MGPVTPTHLEPSLTLKTDLVTSDPPTQEPKKDSISMTPVPMPDGPQNLIEKAKSDLAQRLSIAISEINLVKVEEVVWSNASLGCPQPGMVYADMLTAGYLVLLGAKDTVYEYHTSKGTEVIYCVNPLPPVPGVPGDI